MQPLPKKSKLNHVYLPTEIIEKIIICVSDICPKTAFIISNNLSTSFRKGYIRNKLLKTCPSTSIENACAKGQIGLLDWWLYESKLSKQELENLYTSRAIGLAAGSNQIAVLDWWNDKYKKGLLEFKYDAYAVEKATENGNIKVLQWFKDNRFILKWAKSPLNIACISHSIAAYDWWKNSNELISW